ncbi:MAG: asparagine--tRNA ligase, partial [Candidatus Binatia bacterium]
MPEWIYISDIARYEGQEVVLKGWLYNQRSSGKLHFLQVRDGTGIIQCVVFKGDVSPETFQLADHVPQESSLTVIGRVRADTRSPIGFEVSVKSLAVGQTAQEYPITPKDHGIAFLLDHRHLWLRSARQHAILRVRSEVIKACRDYFDGRGFTLLDAPIFTPAACEGTTTLFPVDYFGDTVYLTQSGQLYMEAGALAFGKVYCFGPTFRAEKSKTRRHLTEFWMIEPEVAYCDLSGDMDLAEDFLEYVVQRVLTNRSSELKSLERDLTKLAQVKKPFPRITYGEAIALLQSKGVETQWGADFGADEETLISEAFDRPLIIHRYPVENKAFYMKGDPDDPRVALC